jgi:prophage regulatory protein
MATERLIIYSDLRPKGIALSKLQLWRLEKAGQFLKRVQVTPGRHAWIEREIDEYLAQCIAMRNAKSEAA